jgi:glycosyltransferase involved in cell wall biosynthesis
MKEESLVSVITPTYNRAHLLGKAINSILAQSYSNWELIIIDDCSTDNTEEVINEFDDERIKYVALEENKGNAGARNEGIKIAQGKYITFLDSDDNFHYFSLEKFIECANKTSNFCYCFGGYEIKYLETGETEQTLWRPRANVSFLEELKIGIGCGVFFKKEIIEEVGLFDERLRVAVDTDWLIRLNRICDPVIIDDILITINAHKGARVRNNFQFLLNSYNIIYDKNKEAIERERNLKLKFYYKMQWLNYYQNHLKVGNKLFLELLKGGVFSTKSFLLLFIFNLFPTSIAKKLHRGKFI